MARRRRRRNKDYYEELPQFRLSPGTKRGILVVVFFVLALLTFLAFFEQAGSLGKIVAQIMRLLLGWAAVVSPLIFLGMGVALILAGRPTSPAGGKREGEEPPTSNLRVYIGGVLLTLALTGVLHVIAMRGSPESAFDLVKSETGGGYFGALVAFPLFALVDFWASAVILVALLRVSLVVLFNLDL